MVKLTLSNDYSPAELAWLYNRLILVTNGVIKRYVWKLLLSANLIEIFFTLLTPIDNLFRVTDNVEAASILLSRMSPQDKAILLRDSDLLALAISSNHFRMFDYLLRLLVAETGGISQGMINTLVSEIEEEPVAKLFELFARLPYIKQLTAFSPRLQRVLEVYNQRISQTANELTGILSVPRDVVMYDLKGYLSSYL